ncbi:MAG TPA: hypothetical protein VMT53_27770 [Terriglobales bacterium]|nr:hypothetical protein [Terriglobales bacterium]
MDVHDATISAAVKNAQGKLLMECVLETKAATVLEFIQGLRGTLAWTFEEGILAAALSLAVPSFVPTTKPYQVLRSVVALLESLVGQGFCGNPSL